MEDECIERKVEIVFEVSKILAAQEYLKKELEELRIELAIKDTMIVHLKLENKKMSSEGPCATEKLSTKNTKIKEKIAELTDEVLRLNVEVKALTKQLLDAHASATDRMVILVKSFFSKPPST